MRAVKAMLDDMSQSEAARRFGVSRKTAHGWLKQYRQGGIEELKTKPQGRPKGQTRLAGWQAAQIVRTITDKTPEQLKLPFVLWTRGSVAQLIEERFGVQLSLSTVGRMLKRWGLTPQKPVRRAWEQKPEEVEHWLKVRYPEVRAEAKREGAEIHWGDEMGLRSDHQAGTTYGRRGQTPVVPGTGQRWRCNMISSVTNLGSLRFMVFKGRFNAGVFIDFMARLIKSAKRKVYLVVDGHPAHKAVKVKKWLAEREDQIRLILLPAYSPDMNPDEFLNQDVKQNALGRRRPASQKAMMAHVRSHLRSKQKQPNAVQKYFHAPSVQYAME